MSIDNKFKGITIIPQKSDSESKITIRGSYNPFQLGMPIAVINCGGCKDTYKEKLFFLEGSHFVRENHELICKCGYVDNISYEKVRED